MIQLVESSKGTIVFINPRFIILIHKIRYNLANSTVHIQKCNDCLILNVREEPHEIVDQINMYYKNKYNE